MDTVDTGVDAPHHVVAGAGAEARAALWPTFRKAVANTKSSYNYLFLLFCYMHICIISFYKSVKIFAFPKRLFWLKKCNYFFAFTFRWILKVLCVEWQNSTPRFAYNYLHSSNYSVLLKQKPFYCTELSKRKHVHIYSSYIPVNKLVIYLQKH